LCHSTLYYTKIRVFKFSFLTLSRRGIFSLGYSTSRVVLSILQAIRKNFKLHPHFTLFHVKGHQDSLSDPNDVPFPAQLNIQADSLASTFQQASSHAMYQGPMIPGTGHPLLVENQFIPGYHRRKLHTKRGQRLSYIDWDSHARAINTFEHKSHIRS
jgi:hypothetical protein